MAEFKRGDRVYVIESDNDEWNYFGSGDVGTVVEHYLNGLVLVQFDQPCVGHGEWSVLEEYLKLVNMKPYEDEDVVVSVAKLREALEFLNPKMSKIYDSPTFQKAIELAQRLK